MKYLILIILTFCLSVLSEAQNQLVIFKPKLQITVRNELGSLVENAEILLYKTKEDHSQSINPVTLKKSTNSKGNVMFDDLEPTIYFLSVIKGEANNFGAGEITDTLKINKINKSTIIISE